MADALERLLSSNSKETSKYSLEEQMQSAEDDDDFLSGMSSEAEMALLKSVTEITLDEVDQVEAISEDEVYSKVDEIINNVEIKQKQKQKPITIIEPIIETNSNEELFNYNRETGKTRKKRVPHEPESETKVTSSSNTNSKNYSIIMDQLAKDIIDELIKSKYKINRFDDNQMKIVFSYMHDKF